MKIIVPYFNHLIFNGNTLDFNRSVLPTYVGEPLVIIPECRGVKLSKINLYPGMGSEDYIVDESYFNCLNHCVNTHPELFKDILDKYDLSNNEQCAYCFEELIRETLVRYTICN